MKNLLIALLLLISSATYAQAVYDNVRVLDEINNNSNADAYPWLSPDALRLYFTRGQNGSDNRIMFTERPSTDSTFTTPIDVPLVGIEDPNSCWLSNDELTIYVSDRGSLYFADRSSPTAAFNPPVEIDLTGLPPHFAVVGPSLNLAHDKLFLSYSASDPFAPLRSVVELSRTSSTSFAYDRTLSLPLEYANTIGQLSKDELTFILGTSFNDGSTLLHKITRTSTTDTFDISTLQQIDGINDTLNYNGQPSMSNDSEWIVFVRSTAGWSANDLYITHNGAISSVFDRPTKSVAISLLPNPTSGQFTISLPTNKAEITITDLLGRQILKTRLTQKTATLQLDKKGVYIIYAETELGTASRKLIVIE